MNENRSTSQATAETSTVATDFSFVDPMDVDDGAIPAALGLSVTPRHDTIGVAAKESTTQVCVTIKARDLPDDDDQRAPVDNIVALDVSGSMTGDKLKQCKKTLDLFLRVLKPGDRFGLVTFASEARIEIPIQHMTPENKEAALRKIQSLRAGGCTNVSAAIGLASQELSMIQNPNEVRSIFLLTDGHANCGITNVSDIVEATKNCLVEGVADAMMDTSDAMVEPPTEPRWKTGFGSIFKSHNDTESSVAEAPPTNVTVKSDVPTKSPPVTLHCFGYGKDHDSAFLRQIAGATPGGTYYFVENDSNVGSAFGDALGGLLSVVAQSAVVHITVPPEAAALGVEIVDVFHQQKIKRDNGSYSVTIGDFYAEESRDVIFEVKLAALVDESRIPHAQVTLTYTDAIQKRPVNAGPVVCSMNRPTGNEVSEPNQHVMVQWLRVYATQEMEQAEKMSSNLGDARARIQKALDTIKNASGIDQSDPLIAQLNTELKKVLQGLTSHETFRLSGGHYLQSTMQSHAMQRCSAATYETATVYRGSRKMAMAKKLDTHKK